MPIQKANPWITHADLWTLAGVEAIKAMGGPDVPWQPGRMDYEDEAHADDHRGNISDRYVAKDCVGTAVGILCSNLHLRSRLPDGALGAQHLRDVFGRMGYSDQVSIGVTQDPAVLLIRIPPTGNRRPLRSAHIRTMPC